MSTTLKTPISWKKVRSVIIVMALAGIVNFGISYAAGVGVLSSNTPRPKAGVGVLSSNTPRPKAGVGVLSSNTPRPKAGVGVLSSNTPRP